ncbi:MAG: hypothetical protein QW156_01945 [Candidatus Aenigmatarchaeota archaeon]
MRTFDIILISLLIVLIVVNIAFISLKPVEKETTKKVTNFTTSGIILDSKPNLPSYLPNSDFIFSKSAWLSNENIPPGLPEVVVEQTFGWKSNGYVEMDEKPDGRAGIVILHPVSENMPRYIETKEFVLPSSGYILIGFANLAGKLSYAGDGNADNLFKVYVIDSNTGFRIKIDEFVISPEDGWKDIAYPISEIAKDLSGKKVKIRVEGWAGGPKNLWWGEWGAIDYIDVIS